MGRHAYLIMAHNQLETLKILLEMIDDIRNDIFLHIDRKATFTVKDVETVVCNSALYTVPSLDVKWGGYSLVECEISLFKCASAIGKYSYYHLISGVDLPIKTQNQIHAFFEANNGKQFVSFDDINLKKNWHRVKYRWYLQEKKGYKKKNQYNVIDKILIGVQKILRLDFRDKSIIYKLGSNWCSLSDDFVRYLLDRVDEIDRLFKYSAAADEMYIQTILYNSEYYREQVFSDSLIEANLRYYDFPEGSASPRLIECKDIKNLLKSKYLFARKFDYTVCPSAVEYVKKTCSKT